MVSSQTESSTVTGTESFETWAISTGEGYLGAGWFQTDFLRTPEHVAGCDVAMFTDKVLAKMHLPRIKRFFPMAFVDRVIVNIRSVVISKKTEDAVMILQDTDDIQGKVVFVNDECASIFGYTKEELESKSFVELVSPTMLSWFKEVYVKRQANEGVPEYYRSAILTKNGEEIPVETSVKVVEHNGRVATMGKFRSLVASSFCLAGMFGLLPELV